MLLYLATLWEGGIRRNVWGCTEAKVMGEAGLAYGIASLMWARCSKTIEYYQCAGMVLDQAGNCPVFF
jgi:hypothetical protein